MTVFQTTESTHNINDERKARFVEHSRKFANTIVKACLDTWSPISVSLTPHSQAPAPAWSIPTNIWYDSSALSFDSLTAIASNKGLTFHEVLHILYTPRKGAGVTKFAIDNGYTRELNILEDQRIETLATGRWGKSARLWLTPTILTHILSEPDLSGAFILTHGRKYLPKDVRQAVASQFAKPELMKDLARVIDEYRLLVFPKDNTRGEVLLAEFYALLNQMPKVEQSCGGGSSQESGSVRPLPQSQQQKDADRVQPADDKGDSFPSNPAPTDTPSDSNTDSDSATTPTSGDSDGQPTDTPSDSDLPDTNSAGNATADQPMPDTDQPTTSGNGAGKDGESVAKTLRDALSKVIDEARDDIVNDANAINGVESTLDGVEQNIRVATYEAVTVDPKSAQASNSFARVLEDLMAKHDSGWNRAVSSGKVNIGRWVGGCDFDEAFDRFEAGREDAVDIECVILLDVSTSMDDVRREACESMWAIKRALDTVDASTTVITFASTGEILYGANDRATNVLRYSRNSGGTNPLTSLRKAQSILAESNRTMKLVLTITDGAWSENEKCDAIIRDLRIGGVMTGLVNLNTGISLDNDHGFEMVANITDVHGIVSLGRELVATATARNLA